VASQPAPFVQQFVDDDGGFAPNDILVGAADAMLASLSRWEAATRQLRTGS
jgi:hypothetical protein